MKQFEPNVTAVMKYLKDEGFSHSVISEHRLCYKELCTFLTVSGKNYSPEVVYQWIEDHKSSWAYRQYTGWRHCIDQLEDVRKTGFISLDHLSYRKPAYMLGGEFWAEQTTNCLHRSWHPDCAAG